MSVLPPGRDRRSESGKAATDVPAHARRLTAEDHTDLVVVEILVVAQDDGRALLAGEALQLGPQLGVGPAPRLGALDAIKDVIWDGMDVASAPAPAPRQELVGDRSPDVGQRVGELLPAWVKPNQDVLDEILALGGGARE